MTNPSTFRGTWTYAADAVHTPRSIFRKAEPEPAPPDMTHPRETTPASAPAYTPTPERYMTEDEFIELRTAILMALLPYPEARNAISTALQAEKNNPPEPRAT